MVITFGDEIKKEDHGKIKRNIEYWCDVCDIDINLSVGLMSAKNTNTNLEMGVSYDDDSNVFNLIIDDENINYNEDSALLNSYYCHECLHIKDILGIVESGNAHIINNWDCEKEDDLYAHMGFMFWTEYYAHKMTCKAFEEYDVVEERTFFQIAKSFRDWNHKNYKLIENDEVNEENANKRLEDIKHILYDLSHYIAAINSGRRKFYEYSEKVCNYQVFKWLYRRSCTIQKLINKLRYGKHGKYTYSRLRNLGEYLYKHFYLPYGIELYRNEDNTLTFVIY